MITDTCRISSLSNSWARAGRTFRLSRLKVKQDVGHALFVAQQGGRSPNTKIMRGFGGASVVEIIEDHDGDTYRCVYTTRVKDLIAVLHAFQKKSRRGIETPQHDVELVQARLRDARAGEWR